MIDVKLPDPEVPQTLTPLLESVATGDCSVAEAIGQLHDLLGPIRGDISARDPLSVLAVRVVEKHTPRAEGLFIPVDQMRQMWSARDQASHQQPGDLFILLVVSCIQITNHGPVREGATAVQTYLDQVVPE